MSDIKQFKEELTKIIETRYAPRGNKCGWGLLYSKLHTLDKSQNDIIFLGINPGGCADPETKYFSYDDTIKTTGSDYETWYKEAWDNQAGVYKPGQAPLQQQVKYLLENLLHCETENVLSGNVCPFVSRDVKDLDYDDWECGKKVWDKIFKQYIKKHGKVNIIVMGISTENAILKIFENTESELSKLKTLQTGWGSITARFYKNNTDNIKMCYLPHLSRFRIFNRENLDMEKYIQDFFK